MAELIDLARRPDMASVLERTRTRVDRAGTVLARDEILESLDEDRR